LRKGDIIEAVDGKRIDDTTEISLNVRKKNITDKLKMSGNRYGRRFEVPIQLQASPFIRIRHVRLDHNPAIIFLSAYVC
jgi:serine protease Do